MRCNTKQIKTMDIGPFDETDKHMEKRLWNEFQQVRADNKDATANIMWFSRKRDESLNAPDYLYFNQQVCKFIREQSDLQIKETNLFLELQKIYPEYK